MGAYRPDSNGWGGAFGKGDPPLGRSRRWRGQWSRRERLSAMRGSLRFATLSASDVRKLAYSGTQARELIALPVCRPRCASQWFRQRPPRSRLYTKRPQGRQR